MGLERGVRGPRSPRLRPRHLPPDLRSVLPLPPPLGESLEVAPLLHLLPLETKEQDGLIRLETERVNKIGYMKEKKEGRT